MESKVDLQAVVDEVRRIRSAVERLAELGGYFPAVARNAVKIQACVTMLELNFCDVDSLEFTSPKSEYFQFH